MQRYRKWLMLTIPALLLIAVPVLAFNSSAFLDPAQNFVDKTCSKEKVSNINVVLCYLFAKTQEQDAVLGQYGTRLDDLGVSSATMSAQMADLLQRVAALENPPEPATIIFAENRPASFATDFIPIPSGFKSMTFNVSTTGFLITWSPVVNIGGLEVEQHRFYCSGYTQCPEVTIPIIDDAYRFATGTSSGNITAIATLNSEPDSKALLLGSNKTLPFTSEVINTNGLSLIIVTVGQGNPQNLNAIVLQRFEGGVFVEKQRINCDGGAMCPLTSLPILGGDYRVVIEGAGGQAIIGALLRP